MVAERPSAPEGVESDFERKLEAVRFDEKDVLDEMFKTLEGGEGKYVGYTLLRTEILGSRDKEQSGEKITRDDFDKYIRYKKSVNPGFLNSMFDDGKVMMTKYGEEGSVSVGDPNIANIVEYGLTELEYPKKNKTYRDDNGHVRSYIDHKQRRSRLANASKLRAKVDKFEEKHLEAMEKAVEKGKEDRMEASSEPASGLVVDTSPIREFADKKESELRSAEAERAEALRTVRESVISVAGSFNTDPSRPTYPVAQIVDGIDVKFRGGPFDNVGSKAWDHRPPADIVSVVVKGSKFVLTTPDGKSEEFGTSRSGLRQLTSAELHRLEDTVRSYIQADVAKADEKSHPKAKAAEPEAAEPIVDKAAEARSKRERLESEMRELNAIYEGMHSAVVLDVGLKGGTCRHTAGIVTDNEGKTALKARYPEFHLSRDGKEVVTFAIRKDMDGTIKYVFNIPGGKEGTEEYVVREGDGNNKALFEKIGSYYPAEKPSADEVPKAPEGAPEASSFMVVEKGNLKSFLYEIIPTMLEYSGPTEQTVLVSGIPGVPEGRYIRFTAKKVPLSGGGFKLVYYLTKSPQFQLDPSEFKDDKTNEPLSFFGKAPASKQKYVKKIIDLFDVELAKISAYVGSDNDRLEEVLD